MTDLAEIEARINTYYRWFALEAPGVTPREEGTLARLWAEYDRLSSKEEQQ